MVDPVKTESWIMSEWKAISSAPISYITAIIILVPLIWGVLYFYYKGRLNSKDEQLKAKEEQGKIYRNIRKSGGAGLKLC